jgi:hypothetical protein
MQIYGFHQAEAYIHDMANRGALLSKVPMPSRVCLPYAGLPLPACGLQYRHLVIEHLAEYAWLNTLSENAGVRHTNAYKTKPMLRGGEVYSLRS